MTQRGRRHSNRVADTNHAAESERAQARQASRRVREQERSSSPTGRSRRVPQRHLHSANDENTPITAGSQSQRRASANIQFVHYTPGSTAQNEQQHRTRIIHERQRSQTEVNQSSLRFQIESPQSFHRRAAETHGQGHGDSHRPPAPPMETSELIQRRTEDGNNPPRAASQTHAIYRHVPKALLPYRESVRQHDLGRMNISCPSCGALHWLAERLTKSSREHPRFGTCCNSGKVSLPPLPNPPPLLQNLLTGNDTQCKEFRTNIRRYNAAFAFTSLGVRIDDELNQTGHAPYVFRIHGKLCHRSGTLLTSPGESPRYSQLYIYDPAVARDLRSGLNPELGRDTLMQLEDMLRTTHHYATIYRHACEVLSHYSDQDDVSVRLIVKAAQDPR
ncbi:hypothetical protein C8Q80DRAFT_1314819 [Daedaleopsis nitida]|nr:hypothetical protein C8Q80DRAFT_1314819 [Daedaleopsis nitida]